MTNIKKATTDNIPQLCELLEVLFSQEVEFVPNRALQEQGLKTIIESDSIGDVYVTTHNEKIVAMVNILYTYSTALGAKVAMLEDMVVLEEYRGQDIGTKLLDYVLKEMKINGCKRVTLLTDDDNRLSHKFYAKNGFELSSMRVKKKTL